MARYTTENGVCGEGNHPITDAPGCQNKGYTSPTVPRLTFGTPLVRLCRKHYLAAYAVRYPDIAAPEI